MNYSKAIEDFELIENPEVVQLFANIDTNWSDGNEETQVYCFHAMVLRLRKSRRGKEATPTFSLLQSMAKFVHSGDRTT